MNYSNTNQNKKIHVKDINLEGVDKTNDWVLIPQLYPIYQSTNMEELNHSLENTKKSLNYLGIFTDINIRINIADGKMTDDVVPINLTFNVKESNKKSISIKTEVSSLGEPSLSFGCSFNNLWGSAKQLSSNISITDPKNITLGLSLNAPIIETPEKKISLSLTNNKVKYTTAGISESSTNIFPSFSFPSKFGNHIVGYMLSWRQNSIVDDKAFLTVREFAGHSTKFAIKHNFTKDTRDGNIFPSNGYLLKMENEIAGPIGDVKNIKNNIYFQHTYSFPFLNLTTFSNAINLGLILPLNRANINSNIVDRFFIGGSNSLRGFQYHSVGPKIGEHNVGGDIFATIGTYLSFPIPYSSENLRSILRLHAFHNIGFLSNYKDLYGKNSIPLSNSFCSSVGCGLVGNILDFLRLEVNYTHPVHTQPKTSSIAGFTFCLTADL